MPNPSASDAYTLTADSLPSAETPQGETFSFEMAHSRIFPETKRTIFVYVPSEYKAGKPACVYVGLDGLGFKASTVFDNLIAKHQMPVTIAIGVTPGVVSSADGPEDPRFDRSFEFDSRDDRLARFILNEVLPEVESHTTRDGRKIMLSANPNDRAIGGGSTGGIGAFTVAWERPDQFRRVFSAIGTFVGMRGGEQYYVLVRKTEPKPIRIYMQDGVHDEWGGGPEMGDWWMSNLTMERALTFAGYDVQHVWGVGTHNGAQADALFPDAMRWLWRDWPAPVRVGVSGNPVLQKILKPDTDWQLVAGGCAKGTSLTSDVAGKIFYADRKTARPVELRTSNDPAHAGGCESAATDAIAFDGEGRFYAADGSRHEITAASPGSDGAQVVGQAFDGRGLAVRQNGDIYATSRDGVWLIHKDGSKVLLASSLKEPSGIALSPDGLWLFVAQRASRFGYNYRVKADGTLDAGEPFYDFYVPAWADESDAGSVWMDTSGLAYVATQAGVQVFDRNGRVAAILQLPNHAGAASLCFGGEGFHTLYVSTDGKVYARQLYVTGAPAWRPPSKLPPWGAG